MKKMVFVPTTTIMIDNEILRVDNILRAVFIHEDGMYRNGEKLSIAASEAITAVMEPWSKDTQNGIAVFTTMNLVEYMKQKVDYHV